MNLQDEIGLALNRAFQMGQLYWQQADSEYISQQKKSDETLYKFQKFKLETLQKLPKGS